MSAKRLDLDEWWWLVEGGEDPVRAAGRCGVSITAVARAANRAGRAKLAHIAYVARTAERHAQEVAA